MMNRFLPFIAVVLLLGAARLYAQPGDEDRRYRMAQGYEEAGDLKNAGRIYLELYGADPQSNVYFEGVRRTMSGLLQFNDLLPIVAERAHRMPGDLDMRIAHADVLHRTGKRAEAIEEWRAAIALRPEDVTGYGLVAASQVENRAFDAAIETYNQARVRLSDPQLFADQVAQLYGILGRHADATREYLSMLTRDPARISVVMGGLATFTSNPVAASAAIDVVSEASEKRPDFLPYLDLLSWLYTEKGDYAGAFEIAKKLDTRKDSRGSTIYGFADRALRERRYDAAIDAYEYFLATFEKSNVLHTSVIFNYARALEMKYREGGRTSSDEAEKLVDRYRSIASENRNTVPASEALLQIAILEGDDLDDPAEALKVLAELKRDYPRFPARAQALLLEGDMLLRTGEIARAQEVYRRGADTLQRGPDGERYRDLSALRLAETYFYQGEFTEAAERFTALTENTSSEATNDALQYLLILQENLEQNPVPLRSYATGRLLFLQRKWKEAAEAMAKAASGVGAGSLADDALYAKGEAEEAMGEPGVAMETMLGIVARYADGTVADRALFHAAGIAESIPAERAKAIELYTRLLTEYPRSTYVNAARKKIRSLRGES